MKKLMMILGAMAFVGLLQSEKAHAQLTEADPAHKKDKNTYRSMEGVSSVKTVFDFRVGDPEVAKAHLNLIHGMLDNPSMIREREQPEIVIVLLGPSVNLVSADKMKQESGSKAAIAKKISAMDSDGVRFEVCMTAAHVHEVSAESILPEIVQVGNGWISLIGYQQKGYSVIADF